jgi:hypothetical protein
MILPVKLPACLSNTGNLTLVSQFAEADTADTEFTKISVGAAADFASGVLSGGELLLLLLLENHCFLCHFILSSLPYLANGAPMRVRSLRASSSV